jgi:hypothetical protein
MNRIIDVLGSKDTDWYLMVTLCAMSDLEQGPSLVIVRELMAELRIALDQAETRAQLGSSRVSKI